MNRILESILLIMTIGGGFAGADFILMKLVQAGHQHWEFYLLLATALLLYVYVLVAGLIFARNKANTKHLKRALLLQVPWLSTPFLYYQFAAGALLEGRVYASGMDGNGFFGSSFQIALNPHAPWAIGVNFMALALYVLTVKASRRSKA